MGNCCHEEPITPGEVRYGGISYGWYGGIRYI